ncbi:MAG: aminomethyltransferase family protein [Gammaproteobacteria bacterium]|nr:aminomethyltransferase family protein [Gammaproteobacteria bacterium]
MIRAHDDRRVLHTPFHSRVEAACEINEWEDWKGYTTPVAYTDVELEYFAIRNSCGVFDLTPMTKYRITGPDAGSYLDRLLTRNIAKLAIGQVMYACWCNDAGQVLDDGTLFRLDDNVYRICSQERHLDWLLWSAMGFNVQIEDETEAVAALAFQGPTSCAVLKRMGFAGVENLKPYRFDSFAFSQGEILISRTGFTGDLGYELWVTPEVAESLWDQLMAAGRDYGIRPFGGTALGIARIEAGFIQAGVDFVPAQDAVRTGRSRSPYELGLGWLVHLKKSNFNGRKALIEEKANGSRHNLARLLVEGNKPANNSFIFDRKDNLLGTVTSATWSPTTKSNLAFASLDSPWGRPGDELYAEIYYIRELKWTRVIERCHVVEGAFFDPKRRHATPAWDF